MTDIETRLQRLEDIEAIKQLKALYCAHCDDSYNADAIASLFTPEAVWDGSPEFPKLDGREAIREFFAGANDIMSFARHQVINPMIEVDGDEATGSWMLFQPCTAAGEGAMWFAATYNDKYRRVDGNWMIAGTRVLVAFYSPYEKGWDVERLPPGLGAS